MEGIPRPFQWNRIEELGSAIEDRPKIAQAGREIANFFFLKAIVQVYTRDSAKVGRIEDYDMSRTMPTNGTGQAIKFAG